MGKTRKAPTVQVEEPSEEEIEFELSPERLQEIVREAVHTELTTEQNVIAEAVSANLGEELKDFFTAEQVTLLLSSVMPIIAPMVSNVLRTQLTSVVEETTATLKAEYVAERESQSLSPLTKAGIAVGIVGGAVIIYVIGRKNGRRIGQLES